MALRILHWASRLIVAGVFLLSGYFKLNATLQFAAAIASYKLLPMSFILPLATWLPWVEIALGLILLSGWKIRIVSTCAAALLLIFISVLTVTYARGIKADCGCFGFGERISLWTIGRDMLFLTPALFLSLEWRIRGRGLAASDPNAAVGQAEVQ